MGQDGATCVNCGRDADGAGPHHKVEGVGPVCTACWDLAPPGDPRMVFGTAKRRRFQQDPRIARPS